MNDENSKNSLEVYTPSNIGSFFPFTNLRSSTSVPSSNLTLGTLTFSNLSLNTSYVQMETSLVDIPEHL